MKDLIITVDHIDPKKRKATICKVLTHMKKLGYTTVDRYVTDTDDPERIGYITTKGVYDKGWGMCMEQYGLCGKGSCHDCSCGWDKVTVEDFLKFTTSDVEVVKAEPKKINAKIDLSWLRNEAREAISEAIQKKLFEAGVTWRTGENNIDGTMLSYIFVIDNIIAGTLSPAAFNGKEDGCFYTKEQLAKIPEVSVNNALKGNFWTYSTKKEEPKPEGYKVSLAAYTGKAREVISKAIQEEAFKKGYEWGFYERSIRHTEKTHLYFDMRDDTVCYDDHEGDEYFNSFRFKELSVEEILSGALPKVN